MAVQKPVRGRNRRFTQGSYKPLNPKKYLGDPTNIQYLSSWELKCMKHFDTNPLVEKWNSEEMIVHYISPVDQKPHRYYPDFTLVSRDANGNINITVIEVKPYKEQFPPKEPKAKRGKARQTFVNQMKTYLVNQAKWKAAKAICDKKGWNFVVLTEREIYGKK